MKLTLEHLADLPAGATWQAYALVLGADVETAQLDPTIPEPFALLAASQLEIPLTREDDSRRPESWWLRPGREPEPHETKYLRAMGIDGALCTFAAHDYEPEQLVAVWQPGDADAKLHQLAWHDEPSVRAVGTVRAWLAGLFGGYGWFQLDPELRSPIRDVVARALPVRQALRDQRRVRVAAIEATVGAPGSDEAATLAQWEDAAAQLARVEATPWPAPEHMFRRDDDDE